MPEWLDEWLGSFATLSWWEILLYSFLAAFLVQLIITRVILVFTHRTATDLDDKAVRSLRWPIFLTMAFVGIAYALRKSVVEDPEGPGISQRTYRVWVSIMVTIGILAWTRAAMRISDAVLEALARRVDDFRWIEPRSLPLYEILTKLLLLGGAAYGLMLAWDIDVTAWLASAGILGIALGFAAKDTLANLFAGIFILADAPYKLGDFINLDSGERGQVTDIGIRSTRILTRDDVEITLPNALIANSKIVNESSGRHLKRRVRINVGVAYGSDIDDVRETLMAVARDCDLALADPEPRVRFRALGESALEFQLNVWIDRPVLRGRAVDRLLTDITKHFEEKGIEIPFPQRVVHLLQS